MIEAIKQFRTYYPIVVAIASIIIGVIWLVTDPGFEPLLAFLAAGAAMCGIRWPKRWPTKAAPLQGRATFNYLHQNGLFPIGSGDNFFETKWSNGSGSSIHAYSDPDSIESVALAVGANSIKDVLDAASYNATSRAVTPSEGQTIIYKSKNSKFMALQVVDIRATSHGDATDEVTVQWVINPSGSADFT
jgi:hypothetical protein